MNDDLISRQAVTDTTICDGISCNECSFNTCEDGQPGCLLKERVDKLLPVNPQEPKSVLEDIKAEIKEWYWQADKQAIAKDPCVVDAMIDLFIRTINAHISGEPKTGHWIDQYNDGNWHCSKCGAIVEKDEQINHNWYFCYHCGCRMVEPQESEEV